MYETTLEELDRTLVVRYDALEPTPELGYTRWRIVIHAVRAMPRIERGRGFAKLLPCAKCLHTACGHDCSCPCSFGKELSYERVLPMLVELEARVLDRHLEENAPIPFEVTEAGWSVETHDENSRSKRVAGARMR